MKIGIIGASSQVGSSVAYYLKKYFGMEVVCFMRSTYSEVFFDILKIPHDNIDLKDKADLKIKLKDFNAILDFTYPTGQLSSIKNDVTNSIKNVTSCLPKNATYFYMSSIMAYGMPSEVKYVKNYFFSRSSYGKIKRHAENIATVFGKKYQINVYNFRLGQVHGILQSVNSSFREKLSKDHIVYIDGNPGDITNTVFINSIAEAITKCMQKQYEPGTYTIVSSPQWTLKELYEYYLQYYNLPAKLVFISKDIFKNKSSFQSKVFYFFSRHRSLFETFFLINLPSIAIKIKGKYREREVANFVSAYVPNYKNIDFNLLGEPPEKIIPTSNSDIKKVSEIEAEFDNDYSELINKNFASCSFNLSATVSLPVKNILLSVIIPTYKRTGSLKRLIQLLQKQTIVNDMQILLVDQNDKGFLEREIGLSDFLNIEYVWLSNPNVSSARNTGAKLAKGKYLLFLDDDLVPENDFCENGVIFFRHNSRIECFTPWIKNDITNTDGLKGFKKQIIKKINSRLFEITDTISAAIFFSKESFTRSGGFDALLFDFAKAAEDQEFFLRLKFRGIKLYYTTSIFIFHDETQTGGCDLRSLDYWVSRQKFMKAWVFRYKIHRGGSLQLTFYDFIKLYRSVFFNRSGLTSGVPVIRKQIKLFKKVLKETDNYLYPYKKRYEIPSKINHLLICFFLYAHYMFY